MAITLVSGARGTGTVKGVGVTSFTVVPAATLTAGNYAFLGVVTDNAGTTSGDTTNISVTDTGGNTWTRVRERSKANGAAADGVTVAIFKSLLTANLTTGSTITIATGTINAAGAGLVEYSVGAGNTLDVVATDANHTGTTSYSAAVSGLASAARDYLGLAGAEDELSTAATLDTAYTLYTSGSIGSGTAGGNQTNVIARFGHLAETSTGQTFDNSGLTTDDRATILIALEEVTSFATFERSAAIDAAVGVATAGTFFSVFSRTTAIDAALGVAVVPQRALLRSAAVDAALGIAAQGTFFTIFNRTAALDAALGIASDGHGILSRASGMNAVLGVEAAGTFWTVFSRAAAVDALLDISAAGVVIPGGGGPATFERAAAVGITAALETQAIRALQRSAALNATVSIGAVGTFFSILERAVGIDAAVALATSPQRVLLRAAALDVALGISTTAQRALLRSARVDIGVVLDVAGVAGVVGAPIVGADAVFAGGGNDAVFAGAGTTTDWGSGGSTT